MLKVNSSRAAIIGQLNNLPDEAPFGSSGDLFNLTFSAVPLTESFANEGATLADDGSEFTKDTTGRYDLDITNKLWMIGRGFLDRPTMEFDARDGTVEASDRALNPRGEGNPVGDEGVVSIAVGGSFSGNIDFNGDTDDIRVFLVSGQTYHFSLRGTGATPVNDTFLEVYDPAAALVNFDDDGGNGINSMMTIVAGATGNYTIRASSFANPGDPGLGGYTVDVRVQGVDAVGDTNATAVVLNAGTTFGFRETATVSGGADLDRYEVQLEAGKFYTFKVAAGADYATDYTLVPAGEIDTILRLRNAAGTLLATNDDISFPGDISSAFGFLAQTTGTYYLDVTGYAGQTGGYAIEFENIDFQNEDPLQSIRWVDADNIDTVDVNGTPTAYVYFGLAGETFNEPGLVTFGWNAKEKAAVMSALLEYTKITGITYVETLDINQAEFRLNTVSTGNFGAYFYPQDPAYGAQEGIGIFNVNSGGWDKPGVSTQDIPGDQVSLDKGGFAYAVILHEFGHAHGVAHPHDNGGGSDIMLGVTAPTNSYGLFNLNQGVYTVMSYNDAWDFHPDGPSPFTIAGIGNGWSGTLGAFDIAVLQERYGTTAFATGDNTYTLASAQGTGVYYETIWDTGGTDTIAYNGTGRATIDLTAATLDYSATGGGVLSFVDQIPGTAGLDGIFGGFTIANGVLIENATGGSGNDTLIGNAAANVLTGGAGTDIMIGRDGDDTYYVDNVGDLVTEANGGGNDTVFASSSYYLRQSQEIEMLVSNAVGVALIGNEYDQTIVGDSGSNYLDGFLGTDTLNGGAGDDTILVDANDTVVEAVGGGNDLVAAKASYALNAGAEVETLSTLNAGNNVAIALIGNEFGQTIIGNAGANYLAGGGGVDTLDGGAGDDAIFVDGDDLVVEAIGGGNDLVAVVGPGFALNAGAEVETLSTVNAGSNAAVALTGNEFGQTIIGNAGTNFLNGGGGADTLQGLGGDDTYIVDSDDLVLEAVGGGNDLVAASSSYVLNAGARVETLSTINAGNNVALNLTGNEFGQTLIGNAGANNLDGGLGNDTLIGGLGADIFVFSNLTVDAISDMTAGTDKVALDDAVFTGLGGLGALNANAFVIGTAAVDADDRIIYDSATGTLFYDADGVGGVAAVQFASLSTGLALTATDFVVI